MHVVGMAHVVGTKPEHVHVVGMARTKPEIMAVLEPCDVLL